MEDAEELPGGYVKVTDAMISIEQIRRIPALAFNPHRAAPKVTPADKANVPILAPMAASRH